jgi:integrase/recombinase XerD
MASAKKKRGRTAQWPHPSAGAMVPDTLGWWSLQYIEWSKERNYSENTAKLRTEYLLNFAAWCEARGLLYPQEITKPILERYQRTLFVYRKADGKPLSFGAQYSRLVALRVLFRWLSRRNVILSNPASEMELPRLPMQLPRYVLTVHEAEAVLRMPDTSDVIGLRDRAILEVLYATGIRRSELCALRVFDVDSHRGTVFVRHGKGLRDRVVPIGERALLWVDKYVTEARPELVAAIDEGALFLTAQGEPMTLMRATGLVRQYVQAAGIDKKGACHLFRHTAATLMLENGADLRYIQHMLGHAQVTTTQLYTQVSIHKLKEVHALTHPGARLAPTPGADCAELGAAPPLAASPNVGAGGAAAALHALLDAEAEQESEHDGAESWT